jgi:uncharacterized protein YoxC
LKKLLELAPNGFRVGDYTMNNTGKIAAIFIAILLFLVIVLTLKLINARESVGESERTLNRLHNSQIAMYDTSNTIFERFN